jgi:hypothetical protein
MILGSYTRSEAVSEITRGKEENLDLDFTTPPQRPD